MQPALDDVTSMPHVAQIARDSVLGSPQMERLARRVRAELFYFELAATPRLVKGAYPAQGISSAAIAQAPSSSTCSCSS